MKFVRCLLIAGAIAAGSFNSDAQGLGDLLKGLGGSGNGVGDMISNVIDGVFSKSDLTLQDLVGEYTTEGPAVTFKSDNFLQKAGGVAGAAAIESKLKPYYEKYGLMNMTLIVDEEANFTMKMKAINLSGEITKNDSDGTFDFNFKVAGIKLGKFTAYIEKSGSTMKLMFDASKLKDIISAIAKFTGNSMASALGSILDSYEGACIGFKMKSVSNGNSTSNSCASEANSSSQSSTSSPSSTSTGSTGIEALKNILKKGN